MQRGKKPYQQLGTRLRQIRTRLHETVTEVSGAVELEADMIDSYERGETRPSEDMLGLLISHFDIKEDEADELYDLAGYSSADNDLNLPDDMPSLPSLVMIPMDNRVIYTDSANVSVNNYGVVMSFTQNGPNNQPMGIARVGMSIEHAKSVLNVLATTIAQAEKQQKSKNHKQQSDSSEG